MNIKHIHNDSKGAFVIREDGKRLAEVTYSKAGEDKILIDHTEIDDELRGTGTGKKLVLEAVKFARENDIKIIPLCPFAKSVFDKDDSIRDVLT